MTFLTLRRFFLTLAFGGATAVASADVVVLSNRTPQTIETRVIPTGQQPYFVSIASGDSRPLTTDKRLQVEFLSGGQRVLYPLTANSVYYFGQRKTGELDLAKIGLGGTPETMAGRKLPGDARTAEPAVITVKLLADEEEVLTRERWERRLRERAAKASAILERHAGVRFEVVAVEEWRSNNQTRDFSRSLREFEQVVDPKPARLAIGFTSQFQMPRGRVHLGGTRGPLRKHILIREWSRVVNEPEKLELLVHELGHFLGATHSPEADSVMRPVLADRLSRFADFKIRFDAVNTLLISMIGEEMSRRGVDQFIDLTPSARTRLAQVYQTLEKSIPGDRTAGHFRQLSSIRSPKSTIAAQTRQVLTAITKAAEENSRRSEFDRLEGELLTEHYVKAAAAEANELPAAAGPKAFLLALAVGVGDSDAIEQGLQRRAFRNLEDAAQRQRRTEVLGRPTARGRRDLAKHFLVSAGLAAGLGVAEAETLGYAKEVIDAQGGSGFSFADLAADRAGVRFAERVLAGKFRLHTLAKHFRIDHYVPSIEGLEEGLSGAEVVRRFGGAGDERFDAVLKRIDDRIDALPPYSPILIEL